MKINLQRFSDYEEENQHSQYFYPNTKDEVCGYCKYDVGRLEDNEDCPVCMQKLSKQRDYEKLLLKNTFGVIWS